MVLNKRTGKSIASAVLIIFISAILIYYNLLPGMASFLVFKTNLQHADVIIILGGDNERVPYGVKLYKSNYSDKIIVTGGRAELSKEEAINLGAAPKDVILEDKSTTTYEDAQFSRNIMLQNNFTSAIVVSSPYHMRRASWLFGRVFKNDNITLLYSPVDNSWFKVEKWWTNEREIQIVIYEYAKLIYYMFK
ncbi:MAG: YdcF family protein [Candidatus Methanoperedens sp.]